MKNNAIIADFMGLSIKPGVCYYTDKDDMFPRGIEVCEPFIPYDESWDWLMPVVSKIQDIISNLEGDCEEEAEQLMYDALMDVDIIDVHKYAIALIQYLDN